MPIDQKSFSGILNSDDANDVIPIVHHKMAFNGRFRGNGVNMRFENVAGNRIIANPYLPSTGSNECIGAFYDQIRQRIITFNFNDGGKNGIYFYDIRLNTWYRLVESFTSSAEDILNFSLNHPIASVNLLYAPDSDGDILFWCARNDRPKKINLLDAINNVYNNAWISDYLTVARQMPLIQPTCSYHDDGTVDINNLRKKLYQFRYRWVFRNNEKSTCSPYSKLFAPADPDSIATDIDPQKNNRIDVVIGTGAADAVKIEIIARSTEIELSDSGDPVLDAGGNVKTVFSDNFLVATLVKEDLSLADNILYTYQFFNDQAYPFILVDEADQLFDYVPKIANAQELLNGSVVCYGGILFGYDFDTTLDVTSSVTLVDNGVVGSPFIFTQQNSQTFSGGSSPYGGFYYVYFSGTPQVGDVYTLTVVVNDLDNGTQAFVKSYTVLSGDTISDLCIIFQNLFLADSDFGGTYHQTTTVIGGSPTGIKFNPNNGRSHILELTTDIVYSTPPPPTTDDVNIACFHERSKYAFVLLYFDKFGVTNGVVYQVETMVIETPETNTTMFNQPDIPAISFEINHIPPSWAYFYAWARTDSLTFADTWELISDSTEKDSQYGYIEITNYQINDSNFPAYEFTNGDRVRIIGKFIGAGTVLALDFPLVGLLVDPTINGVNKTGSFLKIPYDTSISDFGTIDGYAIEIYTPALNTDPPLQFYYEFGQNYQVLNPTTVNRLHQGQTQDQTSLLPAKFTFTRGDFYIRQRLGDSNWIIDPAVSDNYPSRISGTGRAFVQDVFAKETYFPTQFRWSLAYQQNTNINQTNRFYFLNFDEFDRAKGDIQRLVAVDRILRIAQSRYWGQVGIYAKFIQDSNGTNTLTTTDEIITRNNIQYYSGEYGVGDQYTGIAVSKNNIYFNDPVRGYQCRLAQDGIIPINEYYKGQFYIRGLITPYNRAWVRDDGSNSKILSVYNFFEEEFVTILQGGTNGDDIINDYAFSFNEKRNGYCSFFDFHPEWIISAEDTMYGFLDGEMYKFDDTTNYCKFFGVQYYPSITLAFNDKAALKKSFNGLAYQSNQIWQSRTTGDINTSVFNEFTGLQQVSQLKDVDYTVENNLRYAAFLRDANSGLDPQVALVEGDILQGTWVEVKFTYAGGNFAYLYLPYVLWQIDQRNY